MTNNTAGLSLREAFAQAEEELSLSGDDLGTDISSPEREQAPQVEQPAVETPAPVGLFDDEDEDTNGLEEQPPAADSYEVTVDGERFLVDLDELRSGYMRQSDYTQKTQQLAELERQAEKAMALMAMLEERPQDTLRKLYTRINAGQTLDFTGELNPQAVQPNQGPVDIEALVEARVNELLANDPRLVKVQTDQALERIDAIFRGIEKDYKVTITQDDRDKVLVEAQKRETTDLESVFGAMYAKRLAAERRKEEEKRNLHRVSPLKGEGRVDTFNPQTPSAPKKYDSFRSALEEELALYEQETGVSAL
jgi:hypothetical protein